MRVNKDYVFFWGSEFSNWFPSEFQLEGKKFYNAEQYFMKWLWLFCVLMTLK